MPEGRDLTPRADLQDLDFEIDLQQFEVLSRERRAEKIVRIHNLQLRRYYDLNLSQNVWIFAIGIIVAVLGAVGSLLVNYVATIFLKMHGRAAAHMTSFHSRLVETNQLLMGNLLASRIEDDQTRWSTLSQLALRVAVREGASPAPDAET